MDPIARSSPEVGTTVDVEAALGRLPQPLRQRVGRILSRYPGRILLGTAATCMRIELFDRSMTIAAQFFTSVFPVLILMTAWGGRPDTDVIADALDMPAATRSILDQAA